MFEVLSEDSWQVTDDAGATLGEVRVHDVLDRTGVALLTSACASGTRYRFDPFWIHTHLVERYKPTNDRRLRAPELPVAAQRHRELFGGPPDWQLP